MNLTPLINAFPKKIKITFIDAITGIKIGHHKISSDQLPVSFNKPTNIEWNGVNWRVMQADPSHSKQFTINNKLILYVQDENSVNPDHIGFNAPTYCNRIPASITKNLIFNDFILDASKDKWCQLEFFHLSLLPIISEEMKKIDSILCHEDNINALTGYKKIYVRENIDRVSLSISFTEFDLKLNKCQKGSVSLEECVTDYFALRSTNHTYYGTCKNNIIEELYLNAFECLDEELYYVISNYDLMLADWRNARIIMA